MSIIKDGIVITMNHQRQILDKGCIVIGNDLIVEVGSWEEIHPKYKAHRIIDASDKVVIPGLVDVHSHSGIMRGVGDDLPLYKWHTEWADTISRALHPEDAYLGGLLTYTEAVKAGTTCILDMCHRADECFKAAMKVGIRARLVPYVSKRSEYSDSYEDNLKWVQDTEDRNARVQFWFGFDSFRDSDVELIREICQQARRFGVGIHTHANQSKEDVKLARKLYGKSLIEFFSKINLLGEDAVLAHCVWMSDKELDMLKATKTKVAHCPTSNMKMGNGVAPVPRYLEAGIVTGLGTDGILTNNNVDMIEQLKIAALLHKIQALDSSLLGAVDVFRMATIDGANVLGLENQIGSIEKGKKADLVLLDLDSLHFTPLFLNRYFNILSHLVYAANGQDVHTVLVDGEVLVENHELKTLNEKHLLERVNRASNDLLSRLS